MNSTQLVEDFKNAFCIKANDKLWGPRWEDAQKWYQKKTSLAGVVTALDTLRTDLTDPGRELKRENLQKVHTAILSVPDKKKKRYRAALDQLQVDLNKIVFPETTAGAFQIGVNHQGKPGIIGDDGKQVCPEEKALYVYEVLGKLKNVQERTGVAFDGLEKLIQTIFKDDKLNGSVRGTIWEEAIKFVEEKVVGQVKKDLPKLTESGLVPEGYKLKGIEFTGSDFHKGGKQVLFLRLAGEDGNEKKIVFKPSSLMVDSLLFGKDGVGKVIGDIPTYNIVPITSGDEPPKDQGYGYMDFVDNEGGPTSAEDVKAIYVSAAANLAMSYYVGLEDVHKDNVLVLKKGLQVIDMEATTGVFSMEGGFNDQQWVSAFKNGIQSKLWDLIGERKLVGIPDAGDVWNAMLEKFEAVLENLSKKAVSSQLKELEVALSKQTSRCVPIMTQHFQVDLIPAATKYDTLGAWRNMLDMDLNGEKKLLLAAQVPTSTPLTTIKNLLYTKGVYDALRRGDVPYYVRELGAKTIRDEAGEEIDVTGLKKVGESIELEMMSRRLGDKTAVINLFTTQIKPLVQSGINTLSECLRSYG